MIQFFAPDIESEGILPQDESQHCVRVLRHRAGDEICVIDGKGSRFNCRIVEADPRSVMVEILDHHAVPKHWQSNITLAVAPTKNMDRMEWMTEKAIEIGVDSIVPILCEHSERKVLKTERLRKIAVSAMKQSLKTTLPIINDLIPLKDFCNEIASSNAEKFMGYCDKDYPRRELACEYRPGSDVIIMIGPEGDFSPAEVEMATKAGFIPATFGESRLRTETAAIVALDTVHVLNLLSRKK